MSEIFEATPKLVTSCLENTSQVEVFEAEGFPAFHLELPAPESAMGIERSHEVIGVRARRDRSEAFLFVADLQSLASLYSLHLENYARGMWSRDLS